MLPRLLWILEPAIWCFVFEKPVEAQGFLAYGQKRRAWEGTVAVLTEKMGKDWGPSASLMFLTLVSVVGLPLIPILVEILVADLKLEIGSICEIKSKLAPPIGLEPMTDWLTASRST